MYTKGVHPILLHGGGHERSRRSGTENVAVYAAWRNFRHAVETMPETSARLTKLRDRLIDRILEIPHTQLTGHLKRLPGTVSVVINYIEGDR